MNLQITNPNGKTIRTNYDALGRITQVTTPLGYLTQFTVDANNNVTGIIDANAQAGLQPKNLGGNTVTRQYDELNRLIAETDALNGITRYTYDLAGNLVSLTDASGKVTTNVYDGLGRLTTVIDPLIETPVDKVVSYTYDEAGNPITKTDRLGKITRIGYDALNRATLAEYLSDATSETTVYDIYGNRYSASNGTVIYTYTYDLKNRMLSKTDSRLNKSISYTYDKVGNIQTKTDYQGDITTFEYDATDRLVAESNSAYLSVSYQYDGASRLLGRILSNGAKTSYGWDDDDRLTTLINTRANGVQLNNVSYTRDRIGNIISSYDTISCSADFFSAYIYDALYRLVSADYPGIAFDENFTYDAVGNRSTHTQGTAVHAYEYVPSSNRLKAIHTGTVMGMIEKSFTYNDEGQLTSQTGIGAKTLAWDQKGRPTSITPSGIIANTFSYDPMDRRIARSDSRGIHSAFLEGDHLEAIYSSTQLQAKYMRGSVIDEVVNGYQFDTAGNWTNYTYHHDRLQSVMGQSGHDGTILATQSYTAFGESRGTTGTTSNNTLQYTGRELDTDSGLYQYRARYYSAPEGRFISEDPKGFGAGVNFYAYTNNNPVNANDPSGEEPNVPYPTNIAAHTAAGRYTASQTLAIPGLTPEFGVYVYQLDGNYYHTPSVTSSTTNAVSGAAWQSLQSLIPPGATGIGRNHSHPPLPQWSQNPSPSDWGGVSRAGDSIGRTDGSVILYQNQLGINPRTGTLSPNNPVITPIAPPTTLSPYNFLNGDESITTPSLSPTSFNGFNYGGSAAGGFLLYPNKPNTNQVQSVYAK